MQFIKKYKIRILLILILILAGVLSFWNVWKSEWSNGYYSAAVKSMLESWHNFFFASFDPSGFVSVDKPVLGLWIQCLFAKVFGFHTWALVLPQALATIAGVFLLYKMLTKYFSPKVGLLGALFLATTPIFIAVGRTNNLDATMIFCVILSAFFALKSFENGKLRTLILSIVFVGLGFNIKMVQAFMVLPAIYITYFFFAKTEWKKRIINLVVVTVFLMVISLSWCVAVDLTPSADRPYVGSSSTNSALDLAVGYNGIARFTNSILGKQGGAIPGGVGRPGDMPSGGPGGGGQMPGGSPPSEDGQMPPSSVNAYYPPVFGGQALNAEFTQQYQNMPENVQSGIPSGRSVGIFDTGNPGITRLFSAELYGLIGWYIPIALIGFVLVLVTWRKRTPALIFFASWFIIMFLYFSFGGLTHAYYTATAAPAIAAMAAVGMDFVLKKLSTWLASAVLVMVVICPLMWSCTPMVYGDSSMIPTAGFFLKYKNEISNILVNWQDIGNVNSEVESYLLENYNGEKYMVGVDNAGQAESLIIDTGKGVLLLGGFTGSDIILTLDEFKNLVSDGEIRYFIISRDGMGGGAPGSGESSTDSSANQNRDILSWIKENGVQIEIGNTTIYDLQGTV